MLLLSPSVRLSQNDVTRKRLAAERSGLKFVARWILVQRTWDSFDFVVFWIILGSFGVLV